jgi:phosphoribosylformylglycinamidine synthase PurS subunit
VRFSARVYITLKPAVNDPQGNAVLGSLHTLGFASVGDVRVGKFLTLELDATNQSTAERQVGEMCEKLLANPVIESYRTEVAAAATRERRRA